MPKRGSKRIKSRTHVPPPKEEEEGKVPKTFILRRGKTDKTVGTLVQDLRTMMSPYTAAKLRTRKANHMKDFVAVAGPLGVTHCLALSQTEDAVNLRVGRLPRGPSVVLRVHAYTLCHDVLAAQKRAAYITEAFRFPPLVVLSGFSGAQVASAPERAGVAAVPPGLSAAASSAASTAASTSNAAAAARASAVGKAASFGKQDQSALGSGDWDKALKLTAVTLQHMFPPINVATLRLRECRRIVLFARDPRTGVIEMRHYVIRARPAGVTRTVKKVVQSRQLPDLGGLEDIAEWVAGMGAGMSGGGDGYATSDSEWDEAGGEVTLAQRVSGKGNEAAHQSVLKLSEVGPRLSLGLLRAESGLFGGEVLYHALVRKTEGEAAALRRVHAEKDALKKMRRAEQEANVARKAAESEAKKAAKEERRRARLEAEAATGTTGYDADATEDDEDDDGDDEDEEEEEEDEEVEGGVLGGEEDDDADSAGGELGPDEFDDGQAEDEEDEEAAGGQIGDEDGPGQAEQQEDEDEDEDEEDEDEAEDDDEDGEDDGEDTAEASAPAVDPPVKRRRGRPA